MGSRKTSYTKSKENKMKNGRPKGSVKGKNTKRNALIIRQYWHGAPIAHIAKYWNLSEVMIYKIIKSSRDS